MHLSGNDCPDKHKSDCLEERLLIGVIGGSGLCSLPGLSAKREVRLTNPYGETSDIMFIGDYSGVEIAFLPRHGSTHTIPPHRIPYKANLYALKSLGIRHILATCVAGSLRKEIEPGTFVVPDQFINLTWGRDDAYDYDHRLIHLPMAQPYCKKLSDTIGGALEKLAIPHHKKGTVMVIQGPRFSTIAESKMYALWGGDIVNMTQYPECYFARELGLCYAVMASITDYDVGITSDVVMRHDSFDKILPIFQRNIILTHKVLAQVLQNRQDFSSCNCADTEIHPYF